MKTLPATPYLLPPEDAVSAYAWTWLDGSDIADRVEHWDPYTDLEIVRDIDIDLDLIRESCGLGSDSSLLVVASWYSNRTRLADRAVVALGTLDGLVRAPVTLRIPSRLSGGRLDLHTRIVIEYPGTEVSRISPNRAGATLWHEKSSLQLEGGAARFPITPVAFSSVPRLPDRGSWALEWDREELEAPVLGGLRLLVNVEDVKLMDALRSGSKDPTSGLVRRFVMFDVSRSLVHGALESDRFVEDAETFDEGTIGRMLFDLLSMYWPELPVKALAARRREDPSRLDAELQSRSGVFG
ncbi:hypothetical protein AB0I34_32540 [Kribbella sp. NPDC050281]|uniref:hypothetical protein n=1 Tax=Kribbella sp. NPDC050281 TaxID=3155515 RepID=UPI00340A8BE1